HTRSATKRLSHALDDDDYYARIINGFELKGESRFVALYEYDPSVVWQWWWGQSHADYQNKFDSALADGFQVAHVTCYPVGTEARYAGIWLKKDGAWQSNHGLYPKEYDEKAKM